MKEFAKWIRELVQEEPIRLYYTSAGRMNRMNIQEEFAANARLHCVVHKHMMDHKSLSSRALGLLSQPNSPASRHAIQSWIRTNRIPGRLLQAAECQKQRRMYMSVLVIIIIILVITMLEVSYSPLVCCGAVCAGENPK